MVNKKYTIAGGALLGAAALWLGAKLLKPSFYDPIKPVLNSYTEKTDEIPIISSDEETRTTSPSIQQPITHTEEQSEKKIKYMLVGKVIDDFGAPIKDARVSAEYASLLNDSSLDAGTQTNNNGSFTLPVNDRTLYDLFAEKDENRGTARNVLANQETTIHMSDLPSLFINVASPDSPIVNGDIILESIISHDSSLKKSITRGEAVFTGLEFGAYRIRALAADASGQWFSADVPYTIMERQRYHYDLALEQLIDINIQTVTYESTRERKQPIEGVHITLQGEEYIFGSQTIAFAGQNEQSQNSSTLAAFSDANGMIMFHIPGGVYTATATKKDYAAQEVTFGFSSQKNSIVLYMEPGAALRGYVIDKQEKPISNVKVSVLDSSLSTHTDNEGWFSLEGLSSIETDLNDILFTHDLHQTELLDDLAVSIDPLTISLRDKCQIYGTITDKRGNPVDKTIVELAKTDDRLAGMYDLTRQIITEKDGLYFLRADRGSHMMRISALDYPAHFKSVVIEEGDASKQYDIQLSQGSTLAGRLYFSDGGSLSGIKVGVRQDSRYWKSPFSQFTLTGLNGEWSLENLGEGSYTLYAASPGIGKVWKNIAVPDNSPLELTIDGDIFRTQVTDARHIPLPSVTFHYVYDHNGKGYQKREHLTNESGAYQLVVEGNLEKITISSAGYRPSIFEGVILDTPLLYATLEKE